MSQRYIVMPELLRQLFGYEFVINVAVFFACAVYDTDEDEFAAAVREKLPNWRGAMALLAVGAFVHARRIKLHREFDERVNPDEQLDRNAQLELEDAMRWKMGVALGIELPLIGGWPENRAQRDRLELVIERAQKGITAPDLNLSAMLPQPAGSEAVDIKVVEPPPKSARQKSAGEKAREQQAALNARLREQPLVPVCADGHPVAQRHDHNGAGHRAQRPQRGMTVPGVGKGAQSRAKNGGKKG